MTARMRRIWTLWRRRRTRGDRRWQHFGARSWYGMRMRIAAQAAAGAALDHNRARVLEVFAQARRELEAHRLMTERR